MRHEEHFIVSPAKHGGTKGSLCQVSVCPPVYVFVCLVDIFLVVTHSYVAQATHAFLGMLPVFSLNQTKQKVFIASI